MGRTNNKIYKFPDLQYIRVHMIVLLRILDDAGDTNNQRSKRVRTDSSHDDITDDEAPPPGVERVRVCWEEGRSP